MIQCNLRKTNAYRFQRRAPFWLVVKYLRLLIKSFLFNFINIIHVRALQSGTKGKLLHVKATVGSSFHPEAKVSGEEALLVLEMRTEGADCVSNSVAYKKSFAKRLEQ